MDEKFEFKIYCAYSDINLDKAILTIDECTNYKNIDNEDLQSHNIVLINGDNATFTYSKLTEENTKDQYAYLITVVSDDLNNLDSNIKYINLKLSNGENTEIFYYKNVLYNSDMIHHAEIRALHFFCYNCFDDKQMQLIMLVTFKKQLMNEAIQLKHYGDALKYYLDLCKLLRIGVKKVNDSGCDNCLKYEDYSCAYYEDTSHTLLNDYTQNTINCTNGVCSLI